MKNIVRYLELPVIDKIAMMPLSMEKMDFLTGHRCVDHSIFSKMVRGTLPFERISGQAVDVLFSGGLFFFCDEEDDFVVIARRHNPSRNGMKTRIAPQLSQRLTRIAGAFCNIGK